MTDPLIVEFDVAAPLEHAFDVWTRRCTTWWPESHTISGDPTSITFEPRAGGRIVETAPGGQEHEWGEILEWDPPRRLVYLWHLFYDREEGTEVEVSFTGSGRHTLVRLEQRGWERLGEPGLVRRDRSRTAWAAITPHYAAACGTGWATEH